MYPTHHAPLYLEFREKLDYAHLRNLARTLTNRWIEGVLRPGRMEVVRIGPPLEAMVVTFFWQGELWILGGYWLRFGEPGPDFEKTIARYVEAIRAGKEPT